MYHMTDGHQRLINVLKAAKQAVPDELLKFGTVGVSPVGLSLLA